MSDDVYRLVRADRVGDREQVVGELIQAVSGQSGRRAPRPRIPAYVVADDHMVEASRSAAATDDHTSCVSG